MDNSLTRPVSLHALVASLFLFKTTPLCSFGNWGYSFGCRYYIANVYLHGSYTHVLALDFLIFSGTLCIANLDAGGTIRHTNCEILVQKKQSNRCRQCSTYRSSLRAQLCKLSTAEARLEARIGSHSRTSFKCLTAEERYSRLKHVTTLQSNTSRRLSYLKAKLKDAVEVQGHIVDEDTHSDLTSMIEKYNPDVTSRHPPSSFARIFWEQQLKAARQKDSRGMRWHPVLIKWAIYLRYCSSKAYDTLRSSGVLALPSQRCLRDYTHHFQAKEGFSDHVDSQLLSHSALRNKETWKKYVILLLDEMYIREDLVYNKHTGALVGFVNLSDISNHLEEFEHSLEGGKDVVNSCPPLANSMLVIMVRVLFTKLRLAYAQFTCQNLTGEQIYPLFWEAVYRIVLIVLLSSLRLTRRQGVASLTAKKIRCYLVLRLA